MTATDMPGFASAQREWEAMEPPDGGVCECPDCNGKGELPDPADEDADYVQCETCEGFGLLTARGDPYDPGEAERLECEAADRKRDDHNFGD